MAKTDRIVDADAAAGTIVVSSRPIVKLGLVHSFQIVGGDVYTFLDYLRHRCSMVERSYGVECTVTTRQTGPAAPKPKVFIVPWSNISYVLYGDL